VADAERQNVQGRFAIPAVGLLTITLALAFSATSYGATPSCDLYASPNGSDAAPGTLTEPLGSVQRLADSLGQGEVGCLREGVFPGSGAPGDPFRELKITRPRITLTSAPGEQATISARLWVARGADGVTISELRLDGANSRDLPSPTVNADGAVFRHDEVTNGHTSICFAVGSPAWGRAQDTLIEENRIHACGQLPATNQEHGIYLSAADDTVIRGNWIYDNADRGIQLYPDAQRTVISGNVIYGNGQGLIFSGDEGVAASGARVSGNVIADSRIRRNVESYYPAGGPIGADNMVRSNCIHGAPGAYYGGPDGSGVDSAQVGFTATGNVNRAPQFVDAPAGDLRLVAGSACAAVLDPSTDNRLPGPGTAQQTSAPAPPPATAPAPPPATTPASPPVPPAATPPPASATPPPASAPRRGVTLKAARHLVRRSSKKHRRGRRGSHLRHAPSRG
jgi:parallel beta-helix repeat protein